MKKRYVKTGKKIVLQTTPASGSDPDQNKDVLTGRFTKEGMGFALRSVSILHSGYGYTYIG